MKQGCRERERGERESTARFMGKREATSNNSNGLARG